MGKKKAIIFGAGPAGLTAAYELLHRSDIKPVIYEMTDDIGGIAKTVNYKGNRIDIGGHRFFSKSDTVMKWWLNIIPLQGAPAIDDIKLCREVPLSKEPNAPDPGKEDKAMLTRKRISRIYFSRKFFDYPLTLSIKTLMNLGVVCVFKIGVSYIIASLFPKKRERTLEDFFINRFGRELYLTFFKDYTEKVWGTSCENISAEWGAQRVKGLSVRKAIMHALKTIFSFKDSSIRQKNTETSLIEQFMYPKLGPGQLWEEVACIIEAKGGEIHKHHKIIGIANGDNHINSVTVRDEKTGRASTQEADYFLSTIAAKDLMGAFENGIIPGEVERVARGLAYRDFITVGLLLKRLKIKNESRIETINNIIPDEWLYIQEKDVKLGRVQIFNNWSPYMLKDENTVWVGLEYFCNEGDELWNKTDEEFIGFAIEEVERIGFIEREDILESTLIRMPKTYPAYHGTYDEFDKIRNFTDSFKNLFLIGRNGMHRYNNQDHSMLTAIAAVDNIIKNRETKDNIWAVNIEQEHHEQKMTAVENLTSGILSEGDEEYEYNPDIYWKNTGTSYPYYPTIRHRKRFIVDTIKRYILDKKDTFIFDYGCGIGGVLNTIKKRLNIDSDKLGGCDISERAIDIAKEEIDSPHMHKRPFPKLDRKCDVIVCSEVLEHVKDYKDILRWIRNNLADDGIFILTTQTGRMHASDRYTGHVHHFDISGLTLELKGYGFDIKQSRLWGFPLFTLQKYLTDLNFEKVRKSYLDGKLSLRKRLVFDSAYFLYFIHDIIRFGPQIYIVASKKH